MFRALILFFSYGYNKEKCKITEAPFLTLHFLPYARFFSGQGGHGPSGPMVNTLVIKSDGFPLLVVGVLLLNVADVLATPRRVERLKPGNVHM